MNPLTRRSFLRGAGGAAVALPLLASWPRRASAQSVTFPKRLIVFYTPNGVKPSAWFPTAGATETDFVLNRTHQPLAPFRDRLLLTSGIDMVSADDGPGSPHQRGMGTALTARPLLEGDFIDGCGSVAGWGSGISVDQRIAQAIGGSTRFGSLQLGVRCYGGEVRTRISYLDAEQPLPPENDPTATFARLFSEYHAEPSELQRLRARRRSVLDAVTTSFSEVQTLVGTADQQKLERHLEFIRDIEHRLDEQNLPGDACVIPSAPPVVAPNDESTMPTVTRLQLDLLTMALACDITRVATFQIAESINALRYPFVNSFTEGHSLSHAPASDTVSEEEWIRRDVWHAQQLAYLLNGMSQIQEGGGTLLDNVMVLWISDVAVGNTHSHESMPFLLAGGGGGTLRTGRYVELAHRPHNDLLLTLLHAMDVPDPTFGRPDMTPAVISTLLA